jgi:gliding motility-associated-like protein
LLCETGDNYYVASSLWEHQNDLICTNYIDLDCNDSSGAIEADYNADDVDCNDKETRIADIDIGMEYEAILSEVRIEIVGFIPDAPLEVLISTGNIPNIDVAGDGTEMIILSNAGGAKSTDFKDALRLIRYRNNAEVPTGGLRTVEVQFTTEAGSESNIATAFINVVELPGVPVDLGEDVQVCEGESATFDAGVPGAEYEWSNGNDTQMITVDQSGEYIVTVSDGVNCPGIDTILLETLPVIEVSLSGDTEICDNEQATIIINTNTPFALDVEISSVPGSPFSFPGVTGTTSFNDLINDQTTYTITTVTPSQEACITLSDPEQIIDVYQSFNHAFEVAICDGDSVWLGFYWETESGIYENTFESFDGCDSIVTTTITVAPEIPVAFQATTCIASETGVFVTVIDNPLGCDTIVTTTVTLASLDTTQISSNSCRITDIGMSQAILPGSDGCDSLVITNTAYLPPADTTYLNLLSCDSAAIGTTQLVLPGQNGCDSLIIATTSLSPSDTTYSFGTSCDSASIGVFQSLLQNQSGCDSLVISTVTAGAADTTYTNGTSCDSASLGIFEYHLTSVTGCDSVVFHTVAFSAQDSVFFNEASCDPSQVGVTIQTLSNQFGCDSIITTTTSLLPSNAIDLTNTTCDPDQAGVIVEELQNIYGCDSIVTITTSLLPSNSTNLLETTCNSSEAGVFTSVLINQFGCDSVVTLTVALIDADTTIINNLTCFENEVGVVESLYVGQDGCDSLVLEITALHQLPILQVESSLDYNGFDLSCAGASDGAAEAIILGTSPYTYDWSTNDIEQTITGLTAGNYAITIMDGNGCIESGEITLLEPTELIIALEVSEPDCFDQQLGSIVVIPNGGAAPYTFSIDGAAFQIEAAFENLQNGVYQIIARDANGCEKSEIIAIHIPLSIQVELGSDQIISLGESANLTAVINLPFDSLASIQWGGIDSIECPNCLTQIVAPIITTAYSISVSSVDGCADADTMTVFVSTSHDFYIPNIFSPNGDGINDLLSISASDGVDRILSFSIFDRWGNLVFNVNQLSLGDPNLSWDGRFNGEALNPGVFTYKVKVLYGDGREEVRYGDVTLVR